MTPREMAQFRLANQYITSSPGLKPEEVVAGLGAMQAQDYAGALWGIGLRADPATEPDVEQAIAERKIVRTWLMRGTLHFAAAADVRWMLELLTPRIIAGSALRQRQLELDAAVFARCRKLLVRALQGNRQLTRSAMMSLMEAHGVPTGRQRGYHILWRLAQEGLVCFAARSGKEQTFALLDEWIPHSRKLDRDDALAELALRYFSGHGPATLQDFVWWTGLKVSDARAACNSVGPQLSSFKWDGEDYWLPPGRPIRPAKEPPAFLLPGFDEFLLGYRNRNAILEPKHASRVVPGNNGMFLPMAVLDGRVTGTWKRALNKKGAALTVSPFAALNSSAKNAFATPAGHYGKFLGLPLDLQISKVKGV